MTAQPPEPSDGGDARGGAADGARRDAGGDTRGDAGGDTRGDARGDTHGPAADGARGDAGGDAHGPAADGAAGDAGVIARLRRRTLAAATGPAVLAVALAVLGWVRPGWFVGTAGAVIGGIAVAACTTGALVVLRRASLWARAGRLATRIRDVAAPGATDTARFGACGDGLTVTGIPAACGAAVVLRPPRAGTLRMRRGRQLRAHVMPLRARSGPLAAGSAVVVHARPDGLLPGPEDLIEVHALGARGPFLIVRRADGAVFAADRWFWSVV